MKLLILYSYLISCSSETRHKNVSDLIESCEMKEMCNQSKNETVVQIEEEPRVHSTSETSFLLRDQSATSSQLNDQRSGPASPSGRAKSKVSPATPKNPETRRGVSAPSRRRPSSRRESLSSSTRNPIKSTEDEDEIIIVDQPRSILLSKEHPSTRYRREKKDNTNICCRCVVCFCACLGKCIE